MVKLTPEEVEKKRAAQTELRKLFARMGTLYSQEAPSEADQVQLLADVLAFQRAYFPIRKRRARKP